MSDTPIFSLNQKVIDVGDMSGNLFSTIVDLGEIVHYSVQEIYSGSPVGSILIQASNDGASFSTIDTNAISTSGSKMFNSEAGFRYLKVSYTFGSGTGSLSVYVAGKRA